jgi:hypothetical protein
MIRSALNSFFSTHGNRIGVDTNPGATLGFTVDDSHNVQICLTYFLILLFPEDHGSFSPADIMESTQGIGKDNQTSRLGYAGKSSGIHLWD